MTPHPQTIIRYRPATGEYARCSASPGHRAAPRALGSEYRYAASRRRSRRHTQTAPTKVVTLTPKVASASAMMALLAPVTRKTRPGRRHPIATLRSARALRRSQSARAVHWSRCDRTLDERHGARERHELRPHHPRRTACAGRRSCRAFSALRRRAPTRPHRAASASDRPHHPTSAP
jgi:hypothetical protein